MQTAGDGNGEKAVIPDKRDAIAARADPIGSLRDPIRAVLEARTALGPGSPRRFVRDDTFFCRLRLRARVVSVRSSFRQFRDVAFGAADTSAT